MEKFSVRSLLAVSLVSFGLLVSPGTSSAADSVEKKVGDQFSHDQYKKIFRENFKKEMSPICEYKVKKVNQLKGKTIFKDESYADELVFSYHAEQRNDTSKEITRTITFNESVEYGSTWSKEKSWSYGGEIETEFTTPFGKGKLSANIERSTTDTTVESEKRNRNYTDSIEVPVGPYKKVDVYYNIFGKEVSDIPYTAEYKVYGPVEIEFRDLKPEAIFYKKNNCKDSFHTFKGNDNIDVNCKNHKMKNDEARSLKLVNIPEGTTIEVWDHPDKRDKDDWAEITVRKYCDELAINSFEGNKDEASYKLVKHGKGGLDGKVSRVKIKWGNNARVAKVNIEDYLNEKQRTITIEGQYKGRALVAKGECVAIEDPDYVSPNDPNKKEQNAKASSPVAKGEPGSKNLKSAKGTKEDNPEFNQISDKKKLAELQKLFKKSGKSLKTKEGK